MARWRFRRSVEDITVSAPRGQPRSPYVPATVLALGALTVGGALKLTGHGDAGDLLLDVAVAALLIPLTVDVARTLLVERRLGADVIAMIAMAGALALDQALAGAVVALMFAGGR